MSDRIWCIVSISHFVFLVTTSQFATPVFHINVVGARRVDGPVPKDVFLIFGGGLGWGGACYPFV